MINIDNPSKNIFQQTFKGAVKKNLIGLGNRYNKAEKLLKMMINTDHPKKLFFLKKKIFNGAVMKNFIELGMFI